MLDERFVKSPHRAIHHQPGGNMVSTHRNAARTASRSLGVLALLLAVASPASAQLTLTQPTVAGGGGRIDGGAMEIHATIGETAAAPMPGVSIAGYSGFQATIPFAPRAQSLFGDGFEALPPVAPEGADAPR
jgi:hypothetical protein